MTSDWIHYIVRRQWRNYKTSLERVFAVLALVMETKKEGTTRTKCVARNCKSGNRTSTDIVQFHRFPKDTGLREIWIERVGRDDWSCTDGSRLCSRHFLPSDYSFESKDTNKWRKKKPASATRKPSLKRDAIPSLFHNMDGETPRTTKLASAEMRARIDDEKKKEYDTCLSLDDLLKKVTDFDLPPSVIKVNNIQDLSVSFLNNKPGKFSMFSLLLGITGMTR